MDFRVVWPALQAELDACERSFLAHCESVWRDLEGLLKQAEQQLGAVAYATGDEGKLASIENLLTGPGQALLFDPCERLRKARPLERVLQAIEQHESAVQDILRRVPASVSISGREMSEIVGSSVAAALRKRLLSFFPKPRELPLRRTLRAHFERRLSKRARLDGAYFVLLGQACLACIGPWQILRQNALAVLAGDAPAERDSEKQKERWFRDVAEIYPYICGNRRTLPEMDRFRRQCPCRHFASLRLQPFPIHIESI